MNKDFSHLKKEQLISLRDRYYAGEIVKDLEKEYELSFPLSSRISQLPPIEYQQYSCPYCGIAMISSCQTRRHIDRMEHSMYCPSCKHHPNRYVECNCDNCRRVKSDQLDAKKEEMRRYFSISRPSIDFHSLSLENKIYLGALCAAQLSEDLGYIRSLKSTKATLTPTDEMNRHLYRSLLESGVISVSPDSPISAFDLEHPNFPNVFDEDKVQYSLNLQWPENPSTLISEILQPTYYHPESMHLIEQMNKDLPAGAKKYSFSDFFTFDDAGNVKYETDFLNSWIDSWIDGLTIEGLDTKMKEQMKNAAKAAVEEADTLETLTSTMDKVTSASSLLAQAQEEIADSGKNSVDTIKSLIDMFGMDAGTMMKFGADGSVVVDQEAIKSKIKQEITEVFGTGALAQTLILELDVQMEQEALDDTVDNYMSSVQTLQEAFDRLQSGEFEDSDLAELLREFPELRGHTDDLASGIKELIGQMDEKTIEAFNKAIENAETDEAKRELEAYRDAVLAVGSAVGSIDSSVKIDFEVEGIERPTLQFLFDDKSIKLVNSLGFLKHEIIFWRLA